MYHPPYFFQTVKGKELLETAIRVMDFLGDQIGKQNHLMYLNAKLDLDLKL